MGESAAPEPLDPPGPAAQSARMRAAVEALVEQGNAAASSDAEFLANVGRRVRAAREQRGMVRRALSEAAEVSERYLAQLEAGEGNASIVLLRRVAGALGLRLGSLLDVSEEPLRRRRIALIGLRGAGKSTLGRLLAAELQRRFVELDREIELEAGIPLSEVFLLYGPAGYRRIERQCLDRLVVRGEEIVVSVSGGVVSEPETFQALLRSCFTVWIKASPEEHMARVIAQQDLRPMQGHAHAVADCRNILAQRQPLYGKADAAIDTAGASVDASLAALRRVLGGSPADAAGPG